MKGLISELDKDLNVFLTLNIMKKLSKLQINYKKLIGNTELLHIRGGDPGTCGFSVWIPISESDPTLWNWIVCNVSIHDAQTAVENAGNGNWCCDSCSSTSYCGSY